jgi:phage terminase large subunit-like protein
MSHQKSNPLEKLTRVEQERFLELVKAKHDAETYDKYHTYFFQDHKINEKGYDISRKNYKKHTLFMGMGKLYRERAFIAPNRVGKSYTGGFEVTAHVTKDYPEWWEGKVFPKHKQLEILVVGKTNNSLIQTTQKLLVGTTFDVGSGMIPKELILADKITKKPNCPGGIQDVYVKDKYGCINHIQFMSSDVEDSVIMGRELDFIWFDEECLNSDLYDEAIMRTMTTGGCVITTFTPMDGLTKAIIRFMPGGKFPEGGIVRDKEGEPTGCYTVHCGWNDITHLSAEDQADIRKRYSGPQLLARTEGIPSIGAGHIYPIPVKEVIVATFPVPDHWPRAFGLDFGWRETAAVWVCKNPDTKQMYVYGEYFKGERLPYVHVNAIHAKGDWIRGVCDPAGIATNGTDGKNYIQEYRNLGLDIVQGINDLQTGIAQILNMLEQGTLKFMSHCVHLLDEYSVYCYDDKGKPAKEQDDHALDALRYLVTMFDYVAQSKADFEMSKYFTSDENRDGYSMYNRDSLTGY